MTDLTHAAPIIPLNGSLFQIRFGTAGNAAPLQLRGWSDPEPGFTFSVGTQSVLDLSSVSITVDATCILEVVLKPFITAPQLRSQVLGVRVNGISVGHTYQSERCRLGFIVPRSVCSAGIRSITFDHPAAAAPAALSLSTDSRVLGFAFFQLEIFTGLGFESSGTKRQVRLAQIPAEDEPESVSNWARMRHGIDTHELLTLFESIGDNCEFGLFQRSFGVEPLGLLRFSTINLEPLIEGLETAFEDIGDVSNIEPKPENDDDEWMIYETRYRLRFHSFVRASEMTRDTVKAREHKKLRYLRDKFAEDLADGRKVFVCKRMAGPLCFEEALPVFRALQRYHSNKLLYVVPAADGYVPGTVEELAPNLFRGHIDRLAHPSTPGQHSTIGWYQICLAAFQLLVGCNR